MRLTHIKSLDTQFAQSAVNAKRPDGVLPGRTDINPKYQCGAVMFWGDMVKREIPKESLVNSEAKEKVEILVKALMSIDTTSHVGRHHPKSLKI